MPIVRPIGAEMKKCFAWAHEPSWVTDRMVDSRTGRWRRATASGQRLATVIYADRRAQRGQGKRSWDLDQVGGGLEED